MQAGHGLAGTDGCRQAVIHQYIIIYAGKKRLPQEPVILFR
jgi:hypothetical protein